MTPSRNIPKKKQSAESGRSDINKLFNSKSFFIRVERLKIDKLNMRKVSALEQKRSNSNKKISPERRSEIRIIKAVSNVSKPLNRENTKNKNLSTNEKYSESSGDETSKSTNSNMKSTQWRNVKNIQKMTAKSSTDARNDKKVVEKKMTISSNSKKLVESKLIDGPPMRSKRTPKPNRRYLNDNLITSFKKNDKILRKIDPGLSDTDSENDQINASSSDVDSDILRESDDSSTAGDEYKPYKTKPKPTTSNSIKKQTNISLPTIKQKMLEDAIHKNKLNQFQKLSQGNKTVPNLKSADDPTPTKTIILNKYSYNNNSPNQPFSDNNQLTKTIFDRSQKPKQVLQTNTNPGMARKRPMTEQIQQRNVIKRPKIVEKPNLKSDFDSDLDFNDDEDIDNTDIDDFIKELTSQKQIKVVKKLSQQVNKKSPTQEIRKISNITKKPTILNKVLQQTKEIDTSTENKKNNLQQSTGKILNKSFDEDNDSIESIPDSDKEISDKEDDPFKKKEKESTGDFEKMPTFTIVNINDIIGKKGDFMLEKMKNDPLKSEETCASPDSSDDNSTSKKRKIGSQGGYSSPATQRNRRKAMHTNLLSDNVDKNKEPPPRTPFPPSRNKVQSNKNKIIGNQSNMKLLNNNLKLSKSVSSNKRDSSLSQKSIHRGPPRILNSMVAKKTTPITTFNTKVDTRRSNEPSDSDNEKLMRGKTSKENILKNQLFKQSNENKSENRDHQSIISGIKRKLPSEKVVIQRQGNKIIKKITCFETWYVINLPPETSEKENSVRNIFEMPLIQLANQAKEVDLPNSKWTCKVSLQKLATAKISQNYEPYTGEIYDDYIDPDELHKYRPTNVMFRRQALHPTPKVPYDRAVIFKNNTFFTNIEGKNVKLIGAPHQIEEVRDVEILLNLVDDFSLKNPFVEQAPYVP